MPRRCRLYRCPASHLEPRIVPLTRHGPKYAGRRRRAVDVLSAVLPSTMRISALSRSTCCQRWVKVPFWRQPVRMRTRIVVTALAEIRLRLPETSSSTYPGRVPCKMRNPLRPMNVGIGRCWCHGRSGSAVRTGCGSGSGRTAESVARERRHSLVFEALRSQGLEDVGGCVKPRKNGEQRSPVRETTPPWPTRPAAASSKMPASANSR